MGAFALPQPLTGSASGSFTHAVGTGKLGLHSPTQRPALTFSIPARFGEGTFPKPCQSFTNCNKQQQQNAFLAPPGYFQGDFSVEGWRGSCCTVVFPRLLWAWKATPASPHLPQCVSPAPHPLSGQGGRISLPRLARQSRRAALLHCFQVCIFHWSLQGSFWKIYHPLVPQFCLSPQDRVQPAAWASIPLPSSPPTSARDARSG